jgi:hypothetical protein
VPLWTSQLQRFGDLKCKAADIWKKKCISVCLCHLPTLMSVGVAVSRPLTVVPLKRDESKNHRAPVLSMTSVGKCHCKTSLWKNGDFRSCQVFKCLILGLTKYYKMSLPHQSQFTVTPELWIQSLKTQYGIYAGQWGNWTRLFCEYCCFPLPIIFPPILCAHSYHPWHVHQVWPAGFFS